MSQDKQNDLLYQSVYCQALKLQKSQSLQSNIFESINYTSKQYTQIYIKQMLYTNYEEIKSNQIKKVLNQFKVFQNNKESTASTQIIKINQSIQNQQNVQSMIQKIYKDFKAQEKKIKNINLISFKRVQKFYNNLFVHNIDHSKSHQIIVLDVQLLNFRTKITILNQATKSCLHQNCQNIISGAFGTVYLTRYNQKSYAIKCNRYKYSKFQDTQRYYHHMKELLFIIQQYFVLKLLSELKLGPQVCSISGFDIIATKQCLQFGTQICTQKPFSKDSPKQLKQSLRMMHYLQIVHRDIKPDNIMYSNSLGRHVFIDFGCAQVLNSQVGTKTLTKFVGNTAFCSDQMLSLLNQSSQYVDLYYNDVYGVIKCLSQVKIIQLLFNQTTQLQELESVDFMINRIKYNLFFQHQGDLIQSHLNLIRNYQKQTNEYEIKMLQFLIQTKPNSVIAGYYKNCLSQKYKRDKKYRDLQLIFKNQSIYQSICQSCRMLQQKKRMMWDFRMLYKRLQLQFIQFSMNNQKQIRLALLTKQTALKFINQMRYHVFKGQDLFVRQQLNKLKTQLIYESFKQNIFNAISIQNINSFISLFIVTINYCCLNKNNFIGDNVQISMVERLNLCHRILKDTELTINSQINLVFLCRNFTLQNIAKIFQFFIIYIWKFVPKYFQSQTLNNSIATLCILGYPTHIYHARLFLSSHFISQPKQTKTYKILSFWQCILTIKNYERIYYRKIKDSFLLKLTEIDIIKLMSDEQILFITQKSIKQAGLLQINNLNKIVFSVQIFDYLNKKCYKKLKLGYITQNMSSITDPTILSGINSMQLMDIVYDPSTQISLQQFNLWKQSIITLTSCLPSIFMNSQQFEKQTEGYRSMIQTLKHYQKYQYHLNMFYKCNQLQNIQHIVQIIDETIDYEQISSVLFVQVRFLLALKNKNYQQLLKYLHFIMYDYINDNTIDTLQLKNILLCLKFINKSQSSFYGNYKNETHDKCTNLLNPLYTKVLSLMITITTRHNSVLNLEKENKMQKEYQNKAYVKLIIEILSFCIKFTDKFNDRFLYLIRQQNFQLTQANRQRLLRIDSLRENIKTCKTNIENDEYLYCYICQNTEVKNSYLSLFSLRPSVHTCDQTLFKCVYQQQMKQFCVMFQKLYLFPGSMLEINKILEFNPRIMPKLVIIKQYICQKLSIAINQAFKLKRQKNQENSPQIQQNILFWHQAYYNLFKLLSTFKQVGFFYNPRDVQYIYIAYLGLNKSYQQVYQMMLILASYVQLYQLKSHVDIIHNTFFRLGLVDFFTPKYKPPQQSNIQLQAQTLAISQRSLLNFIIFLSKQTNSINLQSCSHMALFYIYCLRNRLLSKQAKSRIFKFIYKSIGNLMYRAKQIILLNIYQYVNDLYSLFTKLCVFNSKQSFIFTINNIFIQQQEQDFKHRIIITRNFMHSQKLNPRNKVQDQIKITRKNWYFIEKHLKHQFKQQSLQLLVNLRFDIKSCTKNRKQMNMNYPQFVVKMYKKKLAKFHLIQQNCTIRKQRY